MSTIDIKNAHIRFTDGYMNTTKTGQTSALAAVGATSVQVTGMSGVPTIGGKIIIGDNESIITATTVASGTGSITFAPGLTIAVASGDDVVTTAKYNYLDLKIGEGNITYSSSRARQYLNDRGKLDEVRDGDEAPMDVSVDGTWTEVKASSTIPTLEEVLLNKGLAADWVSSDADTCRPFAVNIEVIYTPKCKTEKIATIKLPDYRYEKKDYDLKGGTIKTSGKCMATDPIETYRAQA